MAETQKLSYAQTWIRIDVGSNKVYVDNFLNSSHTPNDFSNNFTIFTEIPGRHQKPWLCWAVQKEKNLVELCKSVSLIWLPICTTIEWKWKKGEQNICSPGLCMCVWIAGVAPQSFKFYLKQKVKLLKPMYTLSIFLFLVEKLKTWNWKWRQNPHVKAAVAEEKPWHSVTVFFSHHSGTSLVKSTSPGPSPKGTLK